MVVSWQSAVRWKSLLCGGNMQKGLQIGQVGECQCCNECYSDGNGGG